MRAALPGALTALNADGGIREASRPAQERDLARVNAMVEAPAQAHGMVLAHQSQGPDR
jgi:hypothetical protein